MDEARGVEIREGAPPRARVVDLGGLAAIADEASDPVVLVIDVRQIERLRDRPDVVVLKRKNARGSLAARMLGHSRIPVVDGGYAAPGRLLQGARALLRKAAERSGGRRGLFVLGASATLLDELARNGVPARPERTGAAPATISALVEALEDTADPRGVELAAQFVGRAPPVRLARALALRAADSTAPVLILGETGTGKEKIARAIHQLGPRRAAAMIAVNCGSIPSELLESELFGHERGAFTGAVTRREGFMKAAHGGTLFLDEIGELTLAHQAKVLRAIEDRSFRPVGSLRDEKVDVRVIGATHRNLASMVRAGQFREDLYYRLCVLVVRTPALREHPEDIPVTASYLWRKIAGEDAVLGDDVLAELKRYPWLGNVREVRSVLAKVHALFGTRAITAAHVRQAVLLQHEALAPVPARRRAEPSWVDCVRHLTDADGVLSGCKIAFGSASRAGGISADAIRVECAELARLGQRPELFHDARTHAAVSGVEQALVDAARAVESSPESMGVARAEVVRAADRALAVIHETIRALIDPARPRRRGPA